MLASTTLPAFASGYTPPTGTNSGTGSSGTTATSTLPSITNIFGIQSISGSTPNVTVSTGNATINIQGPTGALPKGTQVVVGTNSVTNLGAALPSGATPVTDLTVDFQNGSGANATPVTPKSPVTVVFKIGSSSKAGGMSSFPLDSIVYQEKSDGSLTPVPAYVFSKSATVTLTSSSNLVIVNPNIASTQRQVLVNGAPQVVSSGFVAHKTTYMPIYYMFKIFKSDLGLSSTWNGSTWSMKSANPTIESALKNLQVLQGPLPSGNNNYSVTINGVTVASIPGTDSVDPAHGNKTTYLQLYWIMKVLTKLGVGTTWNGSTLDVIGGNASS